MGAWDVSNKADSPVAISHVMHTHLYPIAGGGGGGSVGSRTPPPPLGTSAQHPVAKGPASGVHGHQRHLTVHVRLPPL